MDTFYREALSEKGLLGSSKENKIQLEFCKLQVTNSVTKMTDEGHTVHFCINKKPGNKLKSLIETVKLYFNGCPTFYNQV